MGRRDGEFTRIRRFKQFGGKGLDRIPRKEPPESTAAQTDSQAAWAELAPRRGAPACGVVSAPTNGNQRCIQTFGGMSSGSMEPSGLPDARIGQPRSEMPPQFGHLGAIPGVSEAKRRDNDLAMPRKPSGEARCSTKVAMIIRPFLGSTGSSRCVVGPPHESGSIRFQYQRSNLRIGGTIRSEDGSTVLHGGRPEIPAAESAFSNPVKSLPSRGNRTRARIVRLLSAPARRRRIAPGAAGRLSRAQNRIARESCWAKPVRVPN